MANPEMITIRNKRTGDILRVPRSQFIQVNDSKGLEGIGEDVTSSLKTALPAFGEMLQSIPGGIENIAKYATTTNPVSTLANLGAGGTESAAALLSSPQMLTRYLASKFPALGKRMEESMSSRGKGSFKEPTLYESLSNFEKERGLAPQSEEEASVRNAGGLLFGGGLLKNLPGMLSRTGAITAQQAGQGGDPIHAAILGMTGEMLAKAPISKAKNIPEATMNVVKNPLEAAGNVTSSALDTLSGLGSAAHIPLVPSLTEALSDYIKFKSVKPETLAQRKLFGDITPSHLQQITERLDAAKRLGLSYLTPAEATLSPFEAGKQGKIGRTSTGSKLLFEKGRRRSQSEEEAINKLQENIYDPDQLEPEKQAAYEKAMSASLPDEFLEKWKSDPVVEHAISQLNSKPTYRRAIQNIPDTSFQYWNIVKRVIADMEKEEAVGMKKFSSDQATKVRNEMVSEMDKIQPEYKVARKIAEREFTRQDIEKFFDKRNMSGNEFDKFLKSKKDFKKLLDKLEPYPEAQQNLKDMKLLFGDLIPNDMSIRSAAGLERTSMTSARNKVDAMRRYLDEKYGKEHDVAAVNLMTDPEWAKALTEYMKKKGK